MNNRLEASLPGHFSLRPATDADAGFIFKLYCDTRQQETAEWGWDADPVKTFLTMQYEARDASYKLRFPNAYSYIVETGDGSAVGRLLYDEPESAGAPGSRVCLVDVAVLSPWRGRGIGSALLHALQYVAYRRNVPLTLSVLKSNPALQLYLRQGFVVDADDGVYLSMIWMPEGDINQ